MDRKRELCTEEGRSWIDRERHVGVENKAWLMGFVREAISENTSRDYAQQ